MTQAPGPAGHRYRPLPSRLGTGRHPQLQHTAQLQARTLTDFVVAAVRDAAQRATEQAEVVRLSLADQECFAQGLLSPPEAQLFFAHVSRSGVNRPLQSRRNPATFGWRW